MKFLIIDDHAIVRKGLSQLLKEEFADAEIAEATDDNEVYQKTKNNIWDVILLDISMPGRNGMDILKQLRSENIKAPILVLSMHQEEIYGPRVLKAGANGFLNKESATEELIAAVHRVLAGRKYISPALAEKLADGLNMPNDRSAHDLLSDREMQVTQMLASGRTVSEIATELSLSVNTISTYRNRILEKLALHNNAELTRYAIDHSLV